MNPTCDLCGARKVPTEENGSTCPKCGQGAEETPHPCDYCHAHAASTPSDDGTWICDYCIMQEIVGPAAYAEIIDMQTRLARTSGKPVPLGEAITAWRERCDETRINPGTPASEVNAHAS